MEKTLNKDALAAAKAAGQQLQQQGVTSEARASATQKMASNDNSNPQKSKEIHQDKPPLYQPKILPKARGSARAKDRGRSL